VNVTIHLSGNFEKGKHNKVYDFIINYKNLYGFPWEPNIILIYSSRSFSASDGLLKGNSTCVNSSKISSSNFHVPKQRNFK
jgi:hypothetical protein